MRIYGEQPDPNELGDSSIEKNLEYMTQLGERLAQPSQEIKAMVEMAQGEKQINLDLSNTPIDKFAPRGEYELMLIALLEDMGKVKTAMFEQGLKVKPEDIENHRQEAA
jgi:hypothetical protein